MSMGILEISLYGGFVVIFDKPSELVNIYVPRCTGHYASIFSTEDEQPLLADRVKGMNKVYKVVQSGIRPSRVEVGTIKGAKHLAPHPDYELRTDDPSRVWFCLQFKNPSGVAAIRADADTSEIKGHGAPGAAK